MTDDKTFGLQAAGKFKLFVGTERQIADDLLKYLDELPERSLGVVSANAPLKEKSDETK